MSDFINGLATGTLIIGLIGLMAFVIIQPSIILEGKKQQCEELNFEWFNFENQQTNTPSCVTSAVLNREPQVTQPTPFKTCFWVGANHGKNGIYKIEEPIFYQPRTIKGFAQIEIPKDAFGSHDELTAYGLYFVHSEPAITFSVLKDSPVIWSRGTGFRPEDLRDFVDLNVNYFKCPEMLYYA